MSGRRRERSGRELEALLQDVNQQLAALAVEPQPALVITRTGTDLLVAKAWTHFPRAPKSLVVWLGQPRLLDDNHRSDCDDCDGIQWARVTTGVQHDDAGRDSRASPHAGARSER